MKKTLLLSALALLGFASAKAEQPSVYKGVTLTGQELTSTTTLVDGEKYLIYDGDSGRHAMRYSNEDGTDILGSTTITPTSSATLSPFYVWTAEAVDDNGTTKWRFKNEALQKYIGMLGRSGSNGTNSGLNDEGWLCEYVTHPSNSNALKLYGLNGSSTIMWDGLGNGTMVGWDAGNGHPYLFYPLNQSNLTVDNYYKVVYNTEETSTSAFAKEGEAMPAHEGMIQPSDFPTSVTQNGEYAMMSFAGALEDGALYMIKNVANNLYLNLDIAGTPDSGNNACVNETPTYVVLNVSADNATHWSIMNSVDHTYLDASSWNSIRNSSTPQYWVLEVIDYVGEPVGDNVRFRIKNEKTGTQLGYLGYQSNHTGNKANALWCNCANNNANHKIIWNIERVPNQTLTLTFKRSADDANPLVEEVNVSASVTEFPVYEGFTLQTTGTIAENNKQATYVMNKGEEFRIFNKRAYDELDKAFVFVNIQNNGLRQVASSDDPTSVFYKVPMGDDGGFAIWSEVAQKFVGGVAGTNDPFPMVDFTSTPVKYYSGKQTTPSYMDWIGNRPASATSGYNFFNDNKNSGKTNRFVCGYSWDDDGSKWVIVTDMETFKTNWALSEELLVSAGAYADALRILGREDENGIVEWASNYNFNGNVNLPVSEENQQKIHHIDEVVAEALAYYPNYIMTQPKLYTIQSAHGRGALIYDAENDCLTTTGQNSAGDDQPATNLADPENDNHLWGFVKVNDKYYMYNRGALKFAAAYDIRNGGNGTSTYAWTVSEIPTAIQLTNEAFGAEAALKYNQVTIEGGKNDSERPAGMMIINGNPQRVPCELGASSSTDGTGFILTEVRDTDKDTEMIAAVAAGFAMVSDKVDEIGTLGFEYDADTHGKTVAHYTAEAVNTFGAEIAAAKEEAAKADSDKQAVMYMALDAKVKLNAAESKVQIASGSVYTISDSDGNTHYTDGTGHQIGQFNNVNLSYRNWIATVGENGVVSFHHNHDAGEVQVAGLYYDAAAIPFALDGVSSFKVQPAAELGKVNLLNAENNTRVGDKTYSIGYVSSEAKDATTSISEINVDANGRDAIYDLQGRKLAAPAKGINIINGKKVLVK